MSLESGKVRCGKEALIEVIWGAVYGYAAHNWLRAGSY